MLNKLIPAMALLAASPAFAHQYHEPVRINAASPRYVQAAYPHRQCREEVIPGELRRSSGAGAVIGGIAGGILGNQLGGGDGRIAATAIGAVAGAIVGERLEDAPAPRVVRRCRIVEVAPPRDVVYVYPRAVRRHHFERRHRAWERGAHHWREDD